jgi:hypothetical protein
MMKEPFRGRAIALCLHQDVHNLPVLIDCSPQVINSPVDPDEHLIDMPAPAHAPPVLPQLLGVLGSNLPHHNRIAS